MVSIAYKYEKTIKNLMNNAKGVSWTNIKTHKNAYDELLEVYRKAKAFDEIENILKNYFENHGCYPSRKEYVQEVMSVIDNYKGRADDER